MGVKKEILTLVIIIVSLSILLDKSHGWSSCQIPAIFNFGDDNSDTGGASAAFGRLQPPYGASEHEKPAGRRSSDGRLIIDFFAEKLGLGHLNAYLDSFNNNFRGGANFASRGATISPGFPMDWYANGATQFNLIIQPLNFWQLIHRAKEIYVEKGDDPKLPKPEDFSKAIYTIDIGENDLIQKLRSMPPEKVILDIPGLLNMLSDIGIKGIYGNGGRILWIHNIGPLGCLPYFIEKGPKDGPIDDIGCIKSYNDVAQEFNKQLKQLIAKLQHHTYKDATLIYVDVYTAKYDLFKDAAKYGFKDIHGYCCKHPDSTKQCGDVTFDQQTGTPIFATCNNPKKYIIFDGIHYTEAANQLVANRIMDGSLSHPPVPFNEACAKTEAQSPGL